LQTVTRSIDINGKSAAMMAIRQANGSQSGLGLTVNQPFDVLLENKLALPTALHWHGLHPPNNQDGVPGLTQPAIEPGAKMAYNFKTIPSGTHWMHSHQELQEAFLLAAPLIVHEPDEPADEQQIILFLGDFSFTTPSEILARLRKGPAKPMVAGRMDKPDANDVNYDAYLANDRTLADPEVTRVEKNAKIRLRIINGSSGTNFFINLGELSGSLIAVDGMPVQPIQGSQFPLAIAQRIDVRVQIPREGAFPILAARENASEQTGIVLATPGATVKKIPLQNSSAAGLLTLGLEQRLTAVSPLAAKPIDRTFELRLGGNMAKYQWPINGHVFDVANPRSETAAVRIKEGQRIALKFVNETPMSHPMHLHGHSFQVIEINGKPLSGALRDTILVTPKQTVTVAFDANNPGTWYAHCHILWHLAAGMAVLVQYES
jgi:FtsP/CotA-like multicopper oxidase with cupredoxin domain